MFKTLDINKNSYNEIRKVYRDVLLTSCLEIIKYLSKRERYEATITDIVKALGYCRDTIRIRVKVLEKYGIISTRKKIINNIIYKVVRLEVGGLAILFAP